MRPPAFDVRPTPLLEEERDLLYLAALLKVDEPLFADGAATVAGLPSSDQPVDPCEVESFEGTEKRLSGNEPNRCRYLAERVGAMNKPPVLDRNAHPDVRWPWEKRG